LGCLYGACQDGSACGERIPNRCANNQLCGRNPECGEECDAGLDVCLTGCGVDVSFHDLAVVTVTSALEEGTERALLAKVLAAEQALERAIGQAVQHLATYRSQVRALAGKKMSEGTAAALEMVGRHVETALQDGTVGQCVSALTGQQGDTSPLKPMD
jgi:hypothetical protein